MRFDTIITGGGLSSLACGIKLQKAGKKCLIVSAGQNALHFSSGSFGLLGRLMDGTPVDEPLKTMSLLPEEHPYSKIGQESVSEYVKAIPSFFDSCGIRLKGSVQEGKNILRITPSGNLKRAFLALEEVPFVEISEQVSGTKALVVNFAGFLDFNTAFIAESLEKRGVICRMEAVRIPAVEKLRSNPSEMRSVNISRVMDKSENWKEFAHCVQSLMKGEDIVVIPDVFGLRSSVVNDWIQEMIPAKVLFIGTMPPSVPGIRMQMLLKKAFENAGGMFLQGDEVIDPEYEDCMVKSVRTVNLGSTRLYADSFVLASGGFFGKGLEASPEKVTEPVFGLDVDFPSDRTQWYDENFYSKQEYLGFGVKCDSSFRAFKDGKTISNLYVIGAEAGGCNSVFEGSGAGVAILTAFKAADEIIG